MLQLLAARTLGLESFGVFALLMGAIVVATGLMTGFVGDSLTILDRQDPRIRGALQIWAALLTTATFGVGIGVGMTAGTLSLPGAILFGTTMASWVAQDTVRRLLMASMRFWSVVAVDTVHALSAVCVLAVTWSVRHHLQLSDFMLALLVGQVVSATFGLMRVPRSERAAGNWQGAALRTVAAFGAWRGIQQGIRPTTLTVARLLVVVVAGTAAVGALEAARVFTAPALLFVQGIGSFLLALYAADRRAPVRVAVRRADRAMLGLLAASLVIGAAATGLTGVFGSVITGSRYSLDPVAVAGWAVFAASVAAAMPYASLAAVRGRQAWVVGLRAVDAVLSISAVAAALWLLDLRPSFVPFGVAAGAFIGAAFQRALVLRIDDGRSQAREPEARNRSSASTATNRRP